MTTAERKTAPASGEGRSPGIVSQHVAPPSIADTPTPYLDNIIDWAAKSVLHDKDKAAQCNSEVRRRVDELRADAGLGSFFNTPTRPATPPSEPITDGSQYEQRVRRKVEATCRTHAATAAARNPQLFGCLRGALNLAKACPGITEEWVVGMFEQAHIENGSMADNGRAKFDQTVQNARNASAGDPPEYLDERPNPNSTAPAHTLTDHNGQPITELPRAAADGVVDAEAGRPRVRAADSLKPGAPPRWLAQKRIPQGQVTVLVGDEGIGKSLFWVWITSYITTGRALPEFGIPARPPGVVLLIITEDAWETDVRPRLEAAGANLENVRVLCEDENGEGTPVFPRDFDLIRDCGEPLSLIVVDAWLDTVSPGLKVADTQQARQALDPWKVTAARTGAAVLLLAHTNRISSGSARDRMGATAALRQKARMLLLAQEDEDGNLTIGPEKANGVRIVNATAFTITSVQRFAATDDHDGTVPALTFAGDTDRTARQIHEAMHAARNQRGNGEPGDEVSLWLRETIAAAGTCWAAPTYEQAEQMHGWSTDRVKRAKKKLGAVARKDPDTGHWYWTLPGKGAPKGAQEGHTSHTPAPFTSSQVSEGSSAPFECTPSDLQGSEESKGRTYIGVVSRGVA